MSAPGDEVPWSPTGRQVARAGRSRGLLRARRVPMYQGPLYVDDDEEVALRSGPEVARRRLALWVVVLWAEGMPRQEAWGLINRLGLRGALSPEEEGFLADAEPDPATSRANVWRLEAIWVLLWALGRVEALGWPGGMCDVPRLVELVKPFEESSGLVTGRTLRPASEILDVQDLILRVHWAVRDAWLKGQMVPEHLDWAEGGEPVAIPMCAAVGVVERRLHALNWLVRFGDADWDEVDTPT